MAPIDSNNSNHGPHHMPHPGQYTVVAVQDQGQGTGRERRAVLAERLADLDAWIERTAPGGVARGPLTSSANELLRSMLAERETVRAELAQLAA